MPPQNAARAHVGIDAKFGPADARLDGRRRFGRYSQKLGTANIVL
jgi:hypothetical protein